MFFCAGARGEDGVGSWSNKALETYKMQQQSFCHHQVDWFDISDNYTTSTGFLYNLIKMPGIVRDGRAFDATSDAVDEGKLWLTAFPYARIKLYASSKCIARSIEMGCEIRLWCFEGQNPV